MSIRIDDQKHRALKVLATVKGKSMGSILAELIDEYIERNKAELPNKDELDYLLRLSENSFSEWDNKEDEIYNDL